jgi:hypothetical protein
MKTKSRVADTEFVPPVSILLPDTGDHDVRLLTRHSIRG